MEFANQYYKQKKNSLANHKESEADAYLIRRSSQFMNTPSKLRI